MNDDNNSTRTNRSDERMDDILTLREVAELLRVPEGTLRYWRFCQAGPVSFKIGHHIRYERRDVHQWRRGQRNPGGADVA